MEKFSDLTAFSLPPSVPKRSGAGGVNVYSMRTNRRTKGQKAEGAEAAVPQAHPPRPSHPFICCSLSSQAFVIPPPTATTPGRRCCPMGDASGKTGSQRPLIPAVSSVSPQFPDPSAPGVLGAGEVPEEVFVALWRSSYEDGGVTETKPPAGPSAVGSSV